MHGLQHEIGKKQAFGSGAQEAYLNVLRTAAALDADFVGVFRRRGLTGSSYNALRVLRGEGPCTCGRIGERLVVRVPDVTRLIDRLERLGLAHRERSGEDRRMVLVAITELGRAVLAELDAPVESLHEKQLKHMSAEELRELNRLLVKARTPGAEGAAS